MVMSSEDIYAESLTAPNDTPHPHDRMRVAKPRRACPTDVVRPSRAEINLDNLRHNLRVVERILASPAGTLPALSPPSSQSPRAAVWAVLKADAYGHGAPAVARTLERAGVSGICVALLEEGLELRAAGVRTPILVMGGYYGRLSEGLEDALENNLTPVIYHQEHVERLLLLANKRRCPIEVHLKVDTGIARLGIEARELDRTIATLSAEQRRVQTVGLMTHLACADDDDPAYTQHQLQLFNEVENKARRAGLCPQVRHAANSAGLIQFDEARLDLVRPGIALFGAAPKRGWVPELRPVMTVRSQVVATRELEAGQAVGYGATFRTTRRSTIATVPLGYADGINRKLAGRGEVLIRGRRAPIVGAVSMDLTTVDVTEIEGVALGEEVVFLGGQVGPLGSDEISSHEIAEHTDTIAWEVLTSVSRRVPRFYREP